VRRWRIVETPEFGPVVLPKEELYCPFCGGRMLLHAFYPRKQGPPYNFCHVDVNLKCVECDFYTIFGVPASEEEVEKLKKSRLASHVITREEALKVAELMEISAEALKERLKLLGYW